MKKYVPQLASLQAVCSANYARLMTLLPDCDTDDLSYRFVVKAGTEYAITILESAPYTSSVKMEQLGDGPAYLHPVMEVRLYHDANMAEVTSSQHAGAIAPSYDYPNPDMRHRDEKRARKQFFGRMVGLLSEAQRQNVRKPNGLV